MSEVRDEIRRSTKELSDKIDALDRRQVSKADALALVVMILTVLPAVLAVIGIVL